MRCTSYCTAASYNVALLTPLVKKHFVTTVYRDAIHLAINTGDAFLFPYGVVVCWGLTDEEELQIVQTVKETEIDPYARPERDIYELSYGETSLVQRDEIILSSRDVLSKLSISYALAQSIKLSMFEYTIDKTIKQTKHLPEDLARKGKIFLSRKQISQRIGALFIDRSSVNLYSDMLDEPEFFWDYPEHQPMYREAAKCLDIKTRVEVLNNRLAIAGELLEILNDQLNHQHSSTLEWTIIWLIVIEVVLAVLRDIFHII